MEWRELIVDGYERLPELVEEEALAGVRTTDLDWPPRPGANPLGWTVWHLTRVQDAQIADLMGEPDLWTRDGWHARFNRPPDHDDSGYGHTAAQVRAFRSPSAKVQLDYLRATTDRTKQYLASLSPCRPRPRAGRILVHAAAHGRGAHREHPGRLPPARRRGGLHPRPAQVTDQARPVSDADAPSSAGGPQGCPQEAREMTEAVLTSPPSLVTWAARSGAIPDPESYRSLPSAFNRCSSRRSAGRAT